MAVVTLFKSKTPLHTVQFVHGSASFYNGRFATLNKELEDEIREMVNKNNGKYCGIYIDATDSTVDYIADNGVSLKNQIALDYIAKRGDINRNLGSNDKGGGVGGANTMDNPVLGGTGAMAPAFTTAQTRDAGVAANALRARFQASNSPANTEAGLIASTETPEDADKKD